MKIRLDRQTMAEAVAWAARSLPNRPAMPILGGLLIKATDQGVTLSGFDLETSATVTVAGEVVDEGTVLVPGKLLSDIARSLPNRPVEITSDGSKAELVCGSARFTLVALPVSDYPELPQMPEATGSIDADDFAKAINQVAVAAGRDELLPVFTGVRVEISGEKLSLLATDRYRMALKELIWKPVSPQVEMAALIPARVLSEVARSMTGDGQITLSLASEQLGEGLVGLEGSSSSANRQLTTRLLDGEFPKVRHLMNVQATVSVRVNREELIESVKRVALVAERNTPLRMVINEDSIGLEAAKGDEAQASEAIEAVVENHTADEMAIEAAGFNPQYLTDALGAVESPYVHFSFTAPGKPCLLSGIDSLDGEVRQDYKHVIMLMRLPN